MSNEEYMKMLYTFNHAFDGNKKLFVHWENDLIIKCSSLTGVYETDIEPEDEDYIGEYAAAVSEVEILHPANDDSVQIFNNSIEVSLKNIPQKILLEDGTILWESSVK